MRVRGLSVKVVYMYINVYSRSLLCADAVYVCMHVHRPHYAIWYAQWNQCISDTALLGHMWGRQMIAYLISYCLVNFYLLGLSMD